jgi:hypothetical protein
VLVSARGQYQMGVDAEGRFIREEAPRVTGQVDDAYDDSDQDDGTKRKKRPPRLQVGGESRSASFGWHKPKTPSTTGSGGARPRARS